MDGMGVELREQREVWRGLWRRRSELADLVARTCPRPPTRVIFTGCGDCHAAAEYGESLLDLRSGLWARGYAPMELARAREHLLGPGSLLVALSVSGRTPRVLEAVGVAQRLGAGVVAVTDDPQGPLARAVPATVCLGASPPEALGRTDYRDPEAARYGGYHRSTPQTKTFGAMQMAVAGLCLELERFAPSGRGARREALEGDLGSLPSLAAGAEEAGRGAAKYLEGRIGPQGKVAFCGTGVNGSAARFCAYKLLELARPASFSDIEEFCHTQYLVTEPGDGVVFLVQDEGCRHRVGEIAPVLVEEIGAAVVLLGTDAVALGGEGATFAAGAVRPEVSPLVLGHAGAHLVRRLARSWGLDTDRFRAGLEEERYVRGSTRMIRDSAVRSG